MHSVKQALLLRVGDVVILEDTPCVIEDLDTTTGLVTVVARTQATPRELYTQQFFVFDDVPVGADTADAEPACEPLA